jgi:hypothetical protein
LRDLRRVACGKKAKYGVPRHDLKKADGGEVGKHLPRRRRRQLIDCRKQLIAENDRANPKEKVATRQIESGARFDGVCRGSWGKRGQLRYLILTGVRVAEGRKIRNQTDKYPVLDYKAGMGWRWLDRRDWNIRDAYIKNGGGEKVVDFTQSSEHLPPSSLRAQFPKSFAKGSQSSSTSKRGLIPSPDLRPVFNLPSGEAMSSRITCGFAG